MGYRDKTIRIDAEDLAEGCYVVMRNPRLLTVEQLDTSSPAGEDLSPATAEQRGRDLIAGLVLEWQVWDVETDEELPVPGSGADLARVPIGLFRRLTKVLHDASPQ